MNQKLGFKQIDRRRLKRCSHINAIILCTEKLPNSKDHYEVSWKCKDCKNGGNGTAYRTNTGLLILENLPVQIKNLIRNSNNRML
jgi:ribosomal protein L37AE/L43A